MSRRVLQRAGRLEGVVMHLTYLIHNRVWVALVALAVLGFCIAGLVLLSGKSQEPFGFDELYGLLD
jgi:uncharacterized membrane protein